MASTSLPLPSGRSASGLVSDIILRRNESRKWIDANYRDMWIETWRAIKCRTKPIPHIGAEGKEIEGKEDKSRTNVEMGLANLIYRKNVARLSAQPYNLRVIGGQDPTVGPRFSSLLSQQYDHSKECLEDVRVRMSAEALGIGISKIYWDYVYREMTFRRALMKGGKFAYANRTDLMKARGAQQDEITGAVGELGNDLSQDEINDFLAKNGTEMNVPERVPKYEGPVVKFVFPGDVGWQPFVRTLNESSFITHTYRETDLWLKNKLELTYTDPDSGKEVKAFDPQAVANLFKLDPEPQNVKGDMVELKDMFRQVSQKQTEEAYQFPRYLRVRKLYDIIEEHAQDEDGRYWITWVSESYRDVPLGRMPYPCDFYGQSAFTEEVPLPDLIDSIGDSTPALMRFMFQLYNIQTAQNFDYVTQTLRKIILIQNNTNLTPEVMQLGNFLAQYVDNVNQVKEFQLGSIPPGAFERGGQLLQNMGMFEPSMVGTGAGDNGNPLAGKLATTAILNAKAADSLLQFKIDGRNLYLYWLGMKKVWMNQQMPETNAKPWQVDSKFFGKSMKELLKQQPAGQQPQWALSERMGVTSAIRLDPMEVQEDLEVEPETGSYMSVDDDLKRQAAQDLAAAAAQAPDVFDRRKVATFYASTIRGIDDPESFILPEQPPAPPAPKVGVNFGFTGKMEDFPDVAAVALKSIGVDPPPDLQEQSALNTLKRVSEAGDHAANLLTPEPPPEQPEQPPKPKSKTTLTVQSKKGGENGNGTVQSLIHQFEGEQGE